MNIPVKSLNTLIKSDSFTKQWLVYCLLFAVTVQTLCHGVVLCFEEDGRVEIELNSGRKCCLSFNDKSDGPSFPIISEKGCDDSCGLCIDVPLFISAEKSNGAGFLTLDRLISFLNVSPYLYNVFKHTDTWKNSPFISPVAYHISTAQTVILQV